MPVIPGYSELFRIRSSCIIHGKDEISGSILIIGTCITIGCKSGAVVSGTIRNCRKVAKKELVFEREMRINAGIYVVSHASHTTGGLLISILTPMIASNIEKPILICLIHSSKL
jgi:hypothetical protein